MPAYAFEALTAAGQTEKGLLEAETARAARSLLRSRGLVPLTSSSLLGVLAQRLVRRLCPHCAVPLSAEAATTGGNESASPAPLSGSRGGEYRPVGCEHCGHTGYAGRTGIFELLVVDDAMRALIHRRAPEAEITTAAQTQGMALMRQDGQRLVDTGLTSREELLRVTRD